MWAIAQQVLVTSSIPHTYGLVERPKSFAVHRQRRHPRVVSSSTAFRALQSWSLERDGHLTDASQVVANPRISEGSTVVSSYFRLFRWTTAPRGPHDEEHVMRIFTPALDIGSHINAPRSAAGAALPSDSDWATGLRSAAIPPSALGRDRARGPTVRFHHPPHQTVPAAFTAPGCPGVTLPSRSWLDCPCPQGPVHRRPRTVRTVCPARLRIMRPTARRLPGALPPGGSCPAR